MIVAPKRVAETTWSDESLKWDHLKHLRISKILGSEKSRIQAALSDADIYVINRENVFWLVKNFKSDWKWDMVVLDEFSSFKNPNAKRFKALKKMLPHIKRLYGLTGTPAANGLMDLWAQIYLLDQGKRLYKTIGQYRERYFLPDKRNAQIVYSYKPKRDADRAIRERISDICISIDSSDYVELPECIYQNQSVILSKKSRKAYEEMEKTLVLELSESEITAVSTAALMNKLLQIASGSVYDETGKYHIIHREKLEVLDEIVEQAKSPVLVFYNYRHEKEEILKAFKEAKALESDEDIKAWNQGKIPILLAHPASCGYGLNMQKGGHIAVWYSPTWNLEQYEQANARLNRQGQTEPVLICHIIAKDTVDEIVMNALSRKEEVQTTLLKALEDKYKKEFENGIN